MFVVCCWQWIIHDERQVPVFFHNFASCSTFRILPFYIQVLWRHNMDDVIQNCATKGEIRKVEQKAKLWKNTGTWRSSWITYEQQQTTNIHYKHIQNSLRWVKPKGSKLDKDSMFKWFVIDYKILIRFFTDVTIFAKENWNTEKNIMSNS